MSIIDNLVKDGQGRVINLLEDLSPASNLEMVIKLVRVESTGDVIEWQGFLSCETYTQTFVDRPQEIQLSCNSPLQAFASDKLEMSDYADGLMKIVTIVGKVFDNIHEKGIDYTNIYIPVEDRLVWYKRINTSVFFEEKEISTENTVRFEVEGISYKEVISRICGFMGWCCYERGTDIVFYRIGGSDRLGRCDYSTFIGLDMPFYSEVVDIPSKAMSTFGWMGDDHSISRMMGAKSVAVVASIGSYQAKLGIPEFPYGNMVESYNQCVNDRRHADERTLHLYAYMVVDKSNPYTPYFNFIDYCKADYNEGALRPGNIQHTTLDVALSRINQFETAPSSIASCAFFAKYAVEGEYPETRHNPSAGLYCSFLPNYQWNLGFDEADALFSSKTKKIFTLTNGEFRISCNSTYLTMTHYYSGGQYQLYRGIHNDDNVYFKVLALLRFGDKYWNGSAWVTEWASFYLLMNKGRFVTKRNNLDDLEGIYIPVDAMTGDIEFKLYPMTYNNSGDFREMQLSEAFFTQLNVDFETNGIEKKNERNENRYYRLLGGNFAEDVEITTELATDMNNKPSPTILIEDTNTSNDPVILLRYDDSMTSTPNWVNRRPEVDLLNRMETFYQYIRRKISIFVDKEEMAIPCLDVTDWGYTYRVAAIKRDYIADKDELILLEKSNPQE